MNQEGEYDKLEGKVGNWSTKFRAKEGGKERKQENKRKRIKYNKEQLVYEEAKGRVR